MARKTSHTKAHRTRRRPLRRTRTAPKPSTAVEDFLNNPTPPVTVDFLLAKIEEMDLYHRRDMDRMESEVRRLMKYVNELEARVRQSGLSIDNVRGDDLSRIDYERYLREIRRQNDKYQAQAETLRDRIKFTNYDPRKINPETF